MNALIIGTRGSPLAMAQSHFIRDALQKAHRGLAVEIKIIKTSGDVFQTASMSAGGGKGLFTKEIEEQLLAGAIHLAVHSMKDLPTTLPSGLVIGAVPPREDPRDVLVSSRYASVDELPQGARVGTSSVRRKAQLLARRPDLQIAEIRGNVGTRLEKAAQFDAIILAAAGLNRLGLKPVAHPLDFDVMLPAVGQGLIAVEVREADEPTRELLAAINDADAQVCGEAERAFLRAMGGGCQVPYAALASVEERYLKLTGAVFDKHVGRAVATDTKQHAVQLGEQVARMILK